MTTTQFILFHKDTDLEYLFDVKYELIPAYISRDYESPDEPEHVEFYSTVLVSVEGETTHPMIGIELDDVQIEELTGIAPDEFYELFEEYIYNTNF